MSDQSMGSAPVAEATSAPITPETAVEASPVESSNEGSSEVADLEAKASDPLATKEEKKEAVKQLKKYQLKIDGKTEDFEIDLNDDEAVKNHLQMSRASKKKMQESSDLRKAAEEFIDLLRTNPRKVLSDPSIGVDLKKLAQDYLNEEIERASKSPEQLEREALQAELEELRSKNKKEEEKRKADELAKLQNEETAKIETNIQQALDSGGVPKTKGTVRRMAELMMLALENDVVLTPQELVPIMKNGIKEDIVELLGSSPDEVIEELLGKERLSNIRKKSVAKVKQQVAETANSVKSTGNSKSESVKEEKKISMKDFLS